MSHRNNIPGQLSLLPSVELKISTSKKSVMLCHWGVKAGWLIAVVDEHVGGR